MKLEMVDLVLVANKNYNRTPNCICEICNTPFYKRPSGLSKDKHHTCSMKCSKILRSKLMTGELNHQYGLKGDKNASWKSDYVEKGYKLKRVLDHPFRDKCDLVPVYRLVADKYLTNEENSIVIDGKRYLKQECVVHHKDFNKQNDSPENLYIFKNTSMHVLFHNLYGRRVYSLEEFEKYYQENYINKILDYQWLYTAYIDFGLSINVMSELFNIPYRSIQEQINNFNLKEIKNKQNYQLIKNILLKLSNKEIAYEELKTIPSS